MFKIGDRVMLVCASVNKGEDNIHKGYEKCKGKSGIVKGIDNKIIHVKIEGMHPFGDRDTVDGYEWRWKKLNVNLENK